MKFAYLCEKTFDQLTGTDPLVRYCASCASCALEVLDLDRLTPDEQAEWLALHARVGEHPCVTALVPPEEATTSCKTNPFVTSRPMLGRVAAPRADADFRKELRTYRRPLDELQRRYQEEVNPRRQALLTLARARAKGE